jgi:hypothetical protein
VLAWQRREHHATGTPARDILRALHQRAKICERLVDHWQGL